MFLSTYELEQGHHLARLHHRRHHRRCRCHAYAPASNTASHDTHEKINSWVSFCSLIWVWGSAWRPSQSSTIKAIHRAEKSIGILQLYIEYSYKNLKLMTLWFSEHLFKWKTFSGLTVYVTIDYTCRCNIM